MDITGLRSDAPQSGLFEHYYVHPALKTQPPDSNTIIILENEEDCFLQFSKMNRLNMIIGAPGSGKTTWATWIQRKSLDQEIDLFPVRINLRNYVSKELLSVHDIVRKTAGIHFEEDLTAENIRSWMKKTLEDTEALIKRRAELEIANNISNNE